MDRSNAPARQLQIVREGFRDSREAEQLDRFLVDADPLLIAALRQEERGFRRRRLAWGFAILLGLVILPLWLWRSASARPVGEPAGRAAQNPLEKARLLVDQGRQLIAEDRDDEAFDDFSLAVELAPGSADAWAELGASQMRNFQSTLAEVAFRRALALAPGNQQALHGLGNLYLRKGEERRAEEIWSQGGLDRQLARLYLLQGRFREAEVHLARLFKSGPADEDELLDRMALAARSRRLDDGLRSLLEPEPAGRSSWAEMGWRLSRQKRYDAAAAAFGKALAVVPGDVNALSGMGLSLLAMNRAPEARVYFERALSLDNDHLRSLNGLAHCLKSEGRVGEAIAVWRQVSQRYPGFNEAVPGLAWAYYELRDYRQAALYFARLIKRHPYDSRVIDALNVAVENLGPAEPD